jgi:ribose transport system substrate-binding protein
MRHKTVPLSGNDARAGVIPIPTTIITGTIEVDKQNVDQFLQN